MSATVLPPLPVSVAQWSTLGPLDLALQHAARGWSVVPTHEKRPLTPRGVHDATTNPDTIRQWWTAHPDAEPAVTDCDVLDIDRKEGQKAEPFEALAAIGLTLADLPPGMFAGVSRGGSGCHVFGVGTVGNGKPLPGVSIDGRGRGSYVVALYDLPERTAITGEFPDEVLTGKVHAEDDATTCEPSEKNPDPPMATVAKAAEDVASVLADMDRLSVLHEGGTALLESTLYSERVGWDLGYLLLAQTLAGIAAHPDTCYSLSEAQGDFMSHAPGSEGTFDPAHKWRDGARSPYPYEPRTGESMFDDLDGSESGGGSLSAFARLAALAASSVSNPPPVLRPGYFAPFGISLMYGGVLNSLVGPGGVGKTNIALKAAGAHAGYTLFVSMEKSRAALLGSAQWLGVDTVRTLIASDLSEATAVVGSAPQDSDLLVLVDSVASACAALGLNENEAGDIGKLEALLMEWNGHASVGCVVTLDHVGHDAGGRARGSSRKGQMIQGRVWVLTPEGGKPTPGRNVTANCTKDNSGERAASWTYELTVDRGPVLVFGAVPNAVLARTAGDAGRILTMLATTGVDYGSGTKARAAIPGGMNGARYKVAAEYLETLGLVEQPTSGVGGRSPRGLRLLPGALNAAVAAGTVTDSGTNGLTAYSLTASIVHESPVDSESDPEGEE